MRAGDYKPGVVSGIFLAVRMKTDSSGMKGWRNRRGGRKEKDWEKQATLLGVEHNRDEIWWRAERC